MNERQKLERNYHGYKVVSLQLLEPVENSDGWEHSIVDEDGVEIAFSYTLADAIWLARNYIASIPEAEPEPEQPESGGSNTVTTGPLEPVDPPEQIESKATQPLATVGVDSDGSMIPIDTSSEAYDVLNEVEPISEPEEPETNPPEPEETE